MTLLVASIGADTLTELKSRAEWAWAGGAEGVEVRIDAFRDDPADLATYLKKHPKRTWIVTCRSVEEGGCFDGKTTDRVSRLRAATQGTTAYVDFELSEWRRSSESRESIIEASRMPDGSGHRLILSAHDFKGAPEDLSALVDPVRSVPEASCGKVAYQADHICDTFRTMDIMRRRGAGVSVIAMGEDGLWTRVLAKKFGAFATYCALDAESATAPGQLTLDEMVNRYRWSAIDASTRIFGVIGGPVAHSMSPWLFNRWFTDADVNAIYLPLRVGGGDARLKRFLDGCRDRNWLDIGGLSVTVPHKPAALRWVGDGADQMAKSIGALNTLVFRDGKVTGYNTDCYAAISSIADALGCSRTDLAGLAVDVLGAGGAARAVVYGLYEVGCKVTVYGILPDETLRLADRFGARAAAWAERLQCDGDVLINCTPVGMLPDVDASPMPADALAGRDLVFDLIYNPLETRLQKDAAAAGTKTRNGLDMLVRQAVTQFTLWTGGPPDTRDAHEMISQELVRRTGPSQCSAPPSRETSKDETLQ